MRFPGKEFVECGSQYAQSQAGALLGVKYAFQSGIIHRTSNLLACSIEDIPSFDIPASLYDIYNPIVFKSDAFSKTLDKIAFEDSIISVLKQVDEIDSKTLEPIRSDYKLDLEDLKGKINCLLFSSLASRSNEYTFSLDRESDLVLFVFFSSLYRKIHQGGLTLWINHSNPQSFNEIRALVKSTRTAIDFIVEQTKAFNSRFDYRIGINYCKDFIQKETEAFQVHSKEEDFDVLFLGPEFIVSDGQPALGVIYKLAFCDSKPTMKISEEVEKMSLPGVKWVYRLYDCDGKILGDVLCLASDRVLFDSYCKQGEYKLRLKYLLFI